MDAAAGMPHRNNGTSLDKGFRTPAEPGSPRQPTPNHNRIRNRFWISVSMSNYKTNRVDSDYLNKWHAECLYMSTMTPEGDWLLGAPGYALATLYTALHPHSNL